MIINLLQSGIIAPFLELLGIVMGLVIVAAFDPWFSLMVIVVAVPVVWLIVAATPRIRRRALANREANSDLTSRTQEVFAAIKVVKANRAEARVFDGFADDSTKALDAAYYLRLDVVILTAIVTFLGGSLFLLSEYIMVAWIRVERETFLGAAFAFIIGFTDLMNVGKRWANAPVDGTEPYVVFPLMACIYFALCLPLSRLAIYLEKRAAKKGTHADSDGTSTNPMRQLNVQSS